MKKVLSYNLDASLRTVIHCLITNALIAFSILIYSGTSHFHLFFTSTLGVDLIVLQILKDMSVFFQLKFIQVVSSQKNRKAESLNDRKPETQKTEN